MMNPEPKEQHKWLQRLVGTWEYEVRDSKETESKGKGTETIRSLGRLWVVGEGKGEMPGGEAADTLITIGFDVSSGKYVGSWIGSMMTNLWTYVGELDKSGQTLTLSSEGPHMTTEGKTAQYQDIIEFKDENYRVFKAQVRNDEGQWQELMTADYRRVQ